MKKEDAAFPVFCGNEHSAAEGMSKRFYAACAAMQGLLSHNYQKMRLDVEPSSVYCHIIVELSYELADELIKQEVKP